MTQRGVTCNTAPASEIGACVSRMLTDPNGAYSKDHVYTEAEKQPVRPGPKAAGQIPGTGGTWSVVADCTVDNFKVNAIHASLTKTGKVLMTAGSGYNESLFEQKVFKTWIWDPATPGTCPREIPMPVGVDLWCSGHSHLSDGRVLFFGGTGEYATPTRYYTGIRQTYAFDDVTETFTFTGMMNVARWYPSGPVDASGNPVVVSGLDEASKLTSVNETYNSTTGKWTQLPGTRTFPMYASMVLRKNGNLCYTGTNFGGRAGTSPGCWTPSTNAWTPITGLQYPDCRAQASNLLLYPAQAQKVMVIGGGCGTGVTGTTAIVDLSAAAPKFTPGPYLASAAQDNCAAVLPDRSTFVSGGDDHNTRPRLQAARLPYGSTVWEQLASPSVPRMYHSTCMQLPDGSVLTLGTNAPDGYVESRFEIYRPWYLQKGITRPNFTSVSATLKLGGSHQALFTGPASVTGASLQTLTSTTHSVDPNQRAVDVPVTASGTWGRVNLKIDANPAMLPPGMYLLTLRDWRNIPSTSKIVRIVPATTAAGVTTFGGGTPAAATPCCCC